eukprot:scaffold183_cov249-Pinguiococcus_pyrenoidosus.AAC.8
MDHREHRVGAGLLRAYDPRLPAYLAHLFGPDLGGRGVRCELDLPEDDLQLRRRHNPQAALPSEDLQGSRRQRRERFRPAPSKTDWSEAQDKLHILLSTKDISYEEHSYDDFNNITKITYTEKDKQAWGGYSPLIVLEYDAKNSYLLSADLIYNRRLANKNLAFRYEELREKLEQEYEEAGLWDEQGTCVLDTICRLCRNSDSTQPQPGDKAHLKDQLAAEKRRALDEEQDLEEEAELLELGGED